MVDWAETCLTIVYVLLLGPPALFLLVGIVASTHAAISDGRSKWRAWKRVQRELRSGSSPVHGWTERFPARLFEDVLVLTTPAPIGRGRWRVGTVGGETVVVARGSSFWGYEIHIGAHGAHDPGHDRDDATRRRLGQPLAGLARRVVDQKVREPLEGVSGVALEALVLQLDGMLWAPLQPPSPVSEGTRPDDRLPLYRAVEAFIPSNRIRSSVGGSGPEGMVREYMADLSEVGWDPGGDGSPPPFPAGDWRSANEYEGHLPGEAQLEDPHWYEPEDMEVLLFTDGVRTLEVRLDPYEGGEVIGLYDDSKDFLARGVLLRIAERMEHRLALGEGW